MYWRCGTSRGVLIRLLHSLTDKELQLEDALVPAPLQFLRARGPRQESFQGRDLGDPPLWPKWREVGNYGKTLHFNSSLQKMVLGVQDWVAVKELNVNYHHRDMWWIMWFLDYGHII